MLESEIKKLTAAVITLTETIAAQQNGTLTEQQPAAEKVSADQPPTDQPVTNYGEIRDKITASCLHITRNVENGKPQIRTVFDGFSAKKVSDLADCDLSDVLAKLIEIGGER